MRDDTTRRVVRPLLLCFCVLVLAAAPAARRASGAQPDGAASGSISDLQRLFQNPPDDARILMRWWWFGPAVTKPELERELRTMKQGGIGGIEVQSVYPLALDDPSQGLKNLPYLSDEFLDALRFTNQTAHQLGMRIDLTLGSGWPYGGPQVPVTEAAGQLRVERLKVDSSARRVPLPHIGEGEKLIGVFLARTEAFPARPEVTEIAVQNGLVSLPSGMSGAHEILFFVASRTGMMVKRAAVGAEGFVVDHYDRTAIDHYLSRVGDRLMTAFGATPPHAVFCDSLEVYGSDWTGDFLEEFQKRRGYDLKPHLPTLAMDVGPGTEEIRHDWGKTLTELFNERFASTVHQWAQRHHTLFRMQGYGIPPAALSSSALADLPEGEGAQWKSLSATRWAASASHLYGVPVTSSETWTWLHSPVFRATPLDMKAEADRHFLQGINQLIGHGWPYTPPGAEYPGWRFYAAAVFDEKNPWWIVMPDVTAYLQRMSFLLRQGQPANDVALYLPTSDAWAHFRPGHVNLFETLREQVGPDVVARILEAGFNLDFLDDEALRRGGKIEGNSLALGANRYRVVILPGVERMPLDTYRKLEEFARGGGIVVATRRLPTLAPGFQASDADQAQVRDITERLFRGPSAPAHFVQDEAQLGGALAALLPPDVSLSAEAPDIGFVHRKLPDADIYFLANTGNQRQALQATFRIARGNPEWWEPMSGKVSPAPVLARSNHGVTVSLDLEPYASRVLIFSGRALSAPAARSPVAGSGTTIDLSRGWRVSFGPSAPAATMNQLRSWTDDENTRYFSGVATYEKTFDVPAAMLAGRASVRLDFGTGSPLAPLPMRAGMRTWLDPPVREAAVVYINGQRAGSLWCPPYALEVSSLLHAGQNTLRVEVANLALNRMAGTRLPDYRLLNLRYGVRFEAQDMDKVRPEPAGLLGPIVLTTASGAHP